MKWHETSDETPKPGAICVCKMVEDWECNLFFYAVYEFIADSWKYPWHSMETGNDMKKDYVDFWAYIEEGE